MPKFQPLFITCSVIAFFLCLAVLLLVFIPAKKYIKYLSGTKYFSGTILVAPLLFYENLMQC